MYAYFKGPIVEKEKDHIVIEVNNIGYNIYMTSQMMEKLPPVFETVKLYTYTCVREDAFLLYGFLSKEDLSMFKLLLGVSGIGPKGAMGILSYIDVADLQVAILSQDAKLLTNAPGIGAKSAGRIILELKDKISANDILYTKNNAADTSTELSNLRGEANEALVSLGYSAHEAFRAVSSVEIKEGNSVEEIIKLALKKLI